MKSILLVDDVAVNIKCAEEVLKEKYEITAVKSGVEALAVLKQILPDLILLDINMPGMNGFEVFEHIKEGRRTANIPVVFITADTSREAEIRSIDMGAAGFIRKPYDPDFLSDKVEKILKMHHHGTDRPRQAKETDVSNELRQKYLKEVIAKADSGQIEGYFILLNMDNFKQINTIFGTAAADDILTRTYAVFKEEVSEGGNLCHIGGDSFILFIEGKIKRDYVRTLIRRIIAGVEFEVNENLPEEYNITVALSAGIAQKPEDGSSFRALYERADKALYYVKQGGKKSYHFYSSGSEETMDTDTEEKHLINILQLERLFKGRENAATESAENLQKASQMILRYWDSKQQIQLILFSVTGGRKMVKDEVLEDKLAKVVSHSLRKGDAAVKCGKLQYLVILQGTSSENGDMVARRIKKKFEENIEDSVVLLGYEMKSI